MSEEIQKFVVDIQPAVAITDETIVVLPVPKGHRVLWVHCKTLIKGVPDYSNGTMTFTFGDAGDPDGYVTIFDSALQTVDKPLGTQGAYLTTAGGKTYTAATNLIATYDYTAGSADVTRPLTTVVNPKLRVIIAVAPQ